jgi:hypothetical protein
MTMIRTPIHCPSEATSAEIPIDESTQAVGPAPATSTEPAREREPDDYLTKLLKYIPGESVAGFAAIAAAAAGVSSNAETVHTLTVVVYLGFLVLTPWYFWANSKELPEAIGRERSSTSSR